MFWWQTKYENRPAELASAYNGTIEGVVRRSVEGAIEGEKERERKSRRDMRGTTHLGNAAGAFFGYALP